jgi:succinoglycan biosynthesis transport protein ExoP
MTTLPQTAPIRVPRPMPAGPLAVPMGAGALASGGPVAGQAGGLSAADVMRVIRQNLWLIALALILGGVGGYAANRYLMMHYPKFDASGYVLIQSPTELPEPGQPVQPLRGEELSLLQETHVRTLMHESLFMEAVNPADSKIRQTDWFKSFDSEPDPMAARRRNLRENLGASPVPRSRLLAVKMTTSAPEDAKTIVKELVDVFISKVSLEQKNNERKQIDLMTKEMKLLQNELDQDVSVQLRAKEQEFGASSVEIAGAWNGKREQLQAMLQEESRIRQSVAGVESVLRGLDENQRDGKTPAEVQQMLSRDGQYLGMKQQVDNMDIVIGQLSLKLGPNNDEVIRNKKLREQYQQKVDEIRETLKSDYTETYRAGLQNQLLAFNANRTVITEQTAKLGGELGRLNEMMQQYGLLKQREQRIQTKVNSFEQDIRRIREFRLAVPWSQAKWSSEPQLPDSPSFPKLPMTMAVSVMAALALSLGIAFLREVTDTTVRSPRDIAKVGQLNLLGLIPHESDDPQVSAGRLPLAIMDAPNSHIAEQFRQIRTRLQYAHSLDTTRSLLVTSPSPNDGKSMVACNLAASLALNGRRILLVDANFRKPSLHATFNVANENGLGDVLSDLDRFGDSVRETDVPNLSLLVSGARPANPAELLESQFFIDFVERALEEYDHVIFDSGPMLMMSETVAIAPRVDGVITVVRARGNSRGLLSRMRDELRRVKAEHIGVVLNAVRSQGGGYYGRNIKKYYAYGDQA